MINQQRVLKLRVWLREMDADSMKPSTGFVACLLLELIAAMTGDEGVDEKGEPHGQ